jgi:hypothetical protein
MRHCHGELSGLSQHPVKARSLGKLPGSALLVVHRGEKIKTSRRRRIEADCSAAMERSDALEIKRASDGDLVILKPIGRLDSSTAPAMQ